MTDQETRSISRTDWLLIGLLIALVLPLRLWLLHNTEVTARDSIGYIRYALQFEQKDWKDVLKGNHQHPGYPVLVYLTSLPVRAWGGATTPDNMALSTQLVSLFASFLFIVPMYFLGRQFFDRTVAFGATLLYQYLPISAQHLSDGVSEPMFLVLLVSSLLQAVHAVRERTVWRCALCGLFTGLAYLTRPEGALLLPAFGIALIGTQFRAEWRSTWKQCILCGVTAVMVTMLIGSIYVIATGRFTNKPPAIETLKNLWKVIEGLLGSNSTPTAGYGHGRLFATSFVPVESRVVRIGQCAWALCAEFSQGLHYVAGIPALLGIGWSFSVLKRNAGLWVVIAFGLLHSFTLISLGLTAHYISDRHVMILVVIGCYFAVFGLRELPRRLLGWLRVAPSAPGDTFRGWYRSAPVWFAIFLVAIIGLCLPKATQRLHANRAENRAAGLWLAERLEEQASDNVNIFDDHAWSHFYSGLIFQEGREPTFPRDHPSKCYIVTTRARESQTNSWLPKAKFRDDARVVWPEHGDTPNGRVVIYLQDRVYDDYPWPLPRPEK